MGPSTGPSTCIPPPSPVSNPTCRHSAILHASLHLFSNVNLPTLPSSSSQLPFCPSFDCPSSSSLASCPTFDCPSSSQRRVCEVAQEQQPVGWRSLFATATS